MSDIENNGKHQILIILPSVYEVTQYIEMNEAIMYGAQIGWMSVHGNRLFSRMKLKLNNYRITTICLHLFQRSSSKSSEVDADFLYFNVPYYEESISSDSAASWADDQ